VTIDDLLRDPRPWIEIPEAGATVGKGRSASYVLADRNVIPTRRIGKRRRVVPRLEFLRSLGIEITAVPPNATSGPAPHQCGPAAVLDPGELTSDDQLRK
jgi:hypothetical protein